MVMKFCSVFLLLMGGAAGLRTVPSPVELSLPGEDGVETQEVDVTIIGRRYSSVPEVEAEFEEQQDDMDLYETKAKPPRTGRIFPDDLFIDVSEMTAEQKGNVYGTPEKRCKMWGKSVDCLNCPGGSKCGDYPGGCQSNVFVNTSYERSAQGISSWVPAEYSMDGSSEYVNWGRCKAANTEKSCNAVYTNAGGEYYSPGRGRTYQPFASMNCMWVGDTEGGEPYCRLFFHAAISQCRSPSALGTTSADMCRCQFSEADCKAMLTCDWDSSSANYPFACNPKCSGFDMLAGTGAADSQNVKKYSTEPDITGAAFTNSKCATTAGCKVCKYKAFDFDLPAHDWRVSCQEESTCNCMQHDTDNTTCAATTGCTWKGTMSEDEIRGAGGKEAGEAPWYDKNLCIYDGVWQNADKADASNKYKRNNTYNPPEAWDKQCKVDNHNAKSNPTYKRARASGSYTGLALQGCFSKKELRGIATSACTTLAIDQDKCDESLAKLVVDFADNVCRVVPRGFGKKGCRDNIRGIGKFFLRARARFVR